MSWILVSSKILVLSNLVAYLDAAMNFDMAYKKMDTKICWLDEEKIMKW